MSGYGLQSIPRSRMLSYREVSYQGLKWKTTENKGLRRRIVCADLLQVLFLLTEVDLSKIVWISLRFLDIYRPLLVTKQLETWKQYILNSCFIKSDSTSNKMCISDSHQYPRNLSKINKTEDNLRSVKFWWFFRSFFLKTKIWILKPFLIRQSC